MLSDNEKSSWEIYDEISCDAFTWKDSAILNESDFIVRKGTGESIWPKVFPAQYIKSEIYDERVPARPLTTWEFDKYDVFYLEE